MEDVTVGGLFVEILKTGALGFLFGAIARAIGRKEFAALIIITTLIFCAMLTYQMVDLMIKSVVNFFEPMMNFFDALSGKKEALNDSINSMQNFMSIPYKGGNVDG